MSFFDSRPEDRAREGPDQFRASPKAQPDNGRAGLIKRSASLLKPAADHLRRLAQRWRLVTARKILYLPHMLSRQEKRLMLLLAAGIIAGGAGFAARMYIRLTHPAPAVSGSYIEGARGSPHAINPLYASRDSDRDLARLIFSGILAYDGHGSAEKDLADQIEISRDGKIYTVFLKKNAVWHDGKPLDADDVIFTIRAIQNPQYKSPLRANWQGVDAEKLDSHAIRFTLRVPYAPFVENLTQGIIPRHLWERVAPDTAILHELNVKPVGTGPYRLSRSQQNGDGTFAWYEVSRNGSYHREGPYLKKIRLRFFETDADMIQAWRKGDIDGFGPVAARDGADLPRSKAVLLPIRMPRVFSLFFNQKKNPALQDIKVRQALAYALDKNAIAEQAVMGGGIVIDQILPPFGAQASGNLKTYEHNPDEARALLEQAGWNGTNAEGIRQKKIRQKGKTETQTLRLTLTTSDWPELLRAAAAIKAATHDAGIDVIVEQKTFAELQDAVIRPRNFEMLLFGQVYGYEPDPFAFWHSSQVKDPGLNVALYASGKADKILSDARRITDAQMRAEKYLEFVNLASRDLPAIPLYTQSYLYVLPADMKGADISKISLPADRFNTVNRWYRKTKRVFF